MSKTSSKSGIKPDIILSNKIDKIILREFIFRILPSAKTNLIHVDIEKQGDTRRVTLNSLRPGVLIGPQGSRAEILRKRISEFYKDKPGSETIVIIKECSKPPSALIYAEEIVRMVMSGTNKNIRRTVSLIERQMHRENKNLLGTYIKISGKFRASSYARTSVFRTGQMKYSGNIYDTQVEEGITKAIPSLGALGVVVRLYFQKDKQTTRPDRLVISSETFTKPLTEEKRSDTEKSDENIETLDLFKKENTRK